MPQPLSGTRVAPRAVRAICGTARERVAARHLLTLGFSRALSRAPKRVPLIGRGRRRGARASYALIAANNFSMARADGTPRAAFSRVVSASSRRTNS